MAIDPSHDADARAVWTARLLDLSFPVVGALAATVLTSGTAPIVVIGGVAGALVRVVWSGATPLRKGAAKAVPAVPRRASALDLAAALPVPLILIDGAGRVRMANPAAETLLQRRVSGQDISLVFRSPSLLSAVEEALRGGPETRFDFRVHRPREMILSATITPLTPDTEGARLALVLRDVSDRSLVAEARSDFVANASHELRTPLAAISGLVETLQGPARDDPAAQERFLGMIAKQTTRMTRLVNDLLSLSRIEADENILPGSEQNLADILRDALAAVRPLAEEGGAHLDVALPDTAVAVRGSRHELTQVFINLIENAIKYAGASGPIHVSAQITDTDAVVTVADSGPGIEAEHIPRLTERFFRVDPEDRNAKSGTGLGLAIVKHIINRHRGGLEITSKPGAGAVFTVSLPLIAPEPR